MDNWSEAHEELEAERDYLLTVLRTLRANLSIIRKNYPATNLGLEIGFIDETIAKATEQ